MTTPSTGQMDNAKGQLEIQQPLPLAFVNGQAVIEKPEDLYIPPDALEVILEVFEGPLDLLLYLIRKQKFDLVNLPVQQITRQYMEYVELMRELNLELAGEYLLMSAILAEVKSRLLLPRREHQDEDETDPRAELIRRLREYEAVKLAAEEVDGIPRSERDFFSARAASHQSVQPIKLQPRVELKDLVLAFGKALEHARALEHHHVAREALSTRERMTLILEALAHGRFMPLHELFSATEGRAGLVVSFLATLELVKENLVTLVQGQPYGQLHLKLVQEAL